MLARLVVCAAALAGLVRGGDYTALDRYIAAPDPSYRYSLARTITSPGLTIYQLDLTSQTWLTPAEVDRTEWRHWVTIFRPSQITTSTALLVIDGGNNTASPATPDPLVTLMAVQAGAIVVDLGQVPNQPLKFAGEDQGRTEDALIAYTWDKYLRTGDERWPARLPMTKAAVRAMNAVTDFLAHQGDPIAIKNFVAMGASKRGWTTWTLAAADPRVIAIAPIVIDTLNVDACFNHTYQVYGFWPPAVQDYVNAGIMNWFGTPQMRSLLEIEDPYQYRDRLTLPKYELASTGDQFFVPDNPQFYFADMPGEKYLRFVPNTDHSMASLDAITGLLTWFRAITGNVPRPRFYWNANRVAGSLRVRTLDAPTKVSLWQATNPKARDFRLQTIGPAWTSKALAGENGIYQVTMPPPAEGYTAFFVELTFPNDLVFTTEVVISPGPSLQISGRPRTRPR